MSRTQCLRLGAIAGEVEGKAKEVVRVFLVKRLNSLIGHRSWQRLQRISRGSGKVSGEGMFFGMLPRVLLHLLQQRDLAGVIELVLHYAVEHVVKGVVGALFAGDLVEEDFSGNFSTAATSSREPDGGVRGFLSTRRCWYP